LPFSPQGLDTSSHRERIENIYLSLLSLLPLSHSHSACLSLPLPPSDVSPSSSLPPNRTSSLISSGTATRIIVVLIIKLGHGVPSTERQRDREREEVKRHGRGVDSPGTELPLQLSRGSRGTSRRPSGSLRVNKTVL
jgi:hypothetical protein